MEHRYSARVDVDLKATIHKRGLMVGDGRIKNGSKYGLLLETSYIEANLLQKLVIEVVVHPAPKKTKRYQLHTIVIRKYAEGLGLELEAIGEQDSVAMGDLINSVRAMSKPPVNLQRGLAMT